MGDYARVLLRRDVLRDPLLLAPPPHEDSPEETAKRKLNINFGNPFVSLAASYAKRRQTHANTNNISNSSGSSSGHGNDNSTTCEDVFEVFGGHSSRGGCSDRMQPSDTAIGADAATHSPNKRSPLELKLGVPRSRSKNQQPQQQQQQPHHHLPVEVVRGRSFIEHNNINNNNPLSVGSTSALMESMKNTFDYEDGEEEETAAVLKVSSNTPPASPIAAAAAVVADVLPLNW